MEPYIKRAKVLAKYMYVPKNEVFYTLGFFSIHFAIAPAKDIIHYAGTLLSSMLPSEQEPYRYFINLDGYLLITSVLKDV